jgi:hypothetical protein
MIKVEWPNGRKLQIRSKFLKIPKKWKFILANWDSAKYQNLIFRPFGVPPIREDCIFYPLLAALGSSTLNYRSLLARMKNHSQASDPSCLFMQLKCKVNVFGKLIHTATTTCTPGVTY